MNASPRRPVQIMLRARADKLLEGDVEGYLAPMTAEARAFEEPWAREVVKLPLSQIDLTIDEATISLDGKRFTGAEITFSYRYKPLPKDNPFKMALTYNLELRDGQWIVTGSSFAEGSTPPLWAIGNAVVGDSPHFMVLSRPDTPRVPELIEKAEAGLARLLPKLTLEADKKFLLVLPRDGNDYEVLVGEQDSLAAASVNYRGQPIRPEDRFLIVNVRYMFDRTKRSIEEDKRPVTPEQVFQHELAHAALSRFTRPCTPGWVAEGAATWLADEVRLDEWEEMAKLGLLEPPPLESMGTAEADGTRPPVDYPTANAATLALVERFGAAKFLDFYQNFKELDPPPVCKGRTGRTERSTLSDRLVRRYYGIDLAGLDVMTKEYMAKAVEAG